MHCKVCWCGGNARVAVVFLVLCSFVTAVLGRQMVVIVIWRHHFVRVDVHLSQSPEGGILSWASRGRSACGASSQKCGG